MMKTIKIRSHIKRAAITFRSLSRRRQRIVALSVLILVIAAGFGTASLLWPKRQVVDAGPVKTVTTGLQKGTPTYATVLPKGRTIEALGGWTRVSPPDRDPVYAYVDLLGPTRTIISQQALPKSFQDDPDGKTKELADAYNAKTELVVGSTTVYTGISTGGVESVIFRIKDTLILMKADTSINPTDLKDYVNSLV